MRRITHRFVVPTTIVLFLLFSTFIVYLYNVENAESRRILEEKLDHTADLLSLTSADHLWNYNITGLEENAEAFFSDQEIYSIEVFDDLGNEVIALQQESRGNNLLSHREDVIRDDEKLGEVRVQLTSRLVDERLSNSRNRLLLLFILGYVFTILVVFFVSRVISKPIVQATEFAKQLSNGNLTVPPLVVGKSKDEVSRLVYALNEMHTRFRDLVSELATSASELSSFSEQLSASAEEGNATVESTISVIDQVSTQIEDIIGSTKTAHSVSTKATEITSDGTKHIEDAIGSIEGINDAVTDTVTVINNLAEKSNEIGEIVQLITGVAEQTNLLALNAAIEAARAGEAGRGFAIVADEVRNLAEQTSESTSNINLLVQEIRDSAQAGLTAIKRVEEQAIDGKSIAETAGGAFRDILEGINNTTKKLSQTSTATESLSSYLEQIQEAINGVGGMSSEIATSSTNLTDKAQNLQTKVGQFDV